VAELKGAFKGSSSAFPRILSHNTSTSVDTIRGHTTRSHLGECVPDTGRGRHALVDHAKAGRLTGAVAEDSLAETARVLLAAPRIRQRYPYTDADVQD
jgi:hypothetical protein